MEINININSRKKNMLLTVAFIDSSCRFLSVAQFLRFLFFLLTLALTTITCLPLLLYISSAGCLYWLHICYGNLCRGKWNEMEGEFKYFHF